MAENLMSERNLIVATIDPQDSTTTGLLSDAWDMQKYRKVMAVVMVGTFVTAGSVDATLKASATSNGTFTTLAGKSIAALTEASTDDGKQAIINLSAAEVSTTALRWARLDLTSATSSMPVSVLVIADQGRFTEAYTTIAYADLASVDEIVA